MLESNNKRRREWIGPAAGTTRRKERSGENTTANLSSTARSFRFRVAVVSASLLGACLFVVWCPGGVEGHGLRIAKTGLTLNRTAWKRSHEDSRALSLDGIDYDSLDSVKESERSNGGHLKSSEDPAGKTNDGAGTVPPTVETTGNPTGSPTTSTTLDPTGAPTIATESPTYAPTYVPTYAATKDPSNAPTNAPVAAPTDSPTSTPTEEPSELPTITPVSSPGSVEPTPINTPYSDGYFDTPTVELTDVPTVYEGDLQLMTLFPDLFPEPDDPEPDDPEPDDPEPDDGADSPVETPPDDPILPPSPLFPQPSSPQNSPAETPDDDDEEEEEEEEAEEDPTESPVQSPTDDPTDSPVQTPTDDPTQSPVRTPTDDPTSSPTDEDGMWLPLTLDPRQDQTESPTFNPTFYPTDNVWTPPTNPPRPVTRSPTVAPDETPSPTAEPVPDPTPPPTPLPTNPPVPDPTPDPTPPPTTRPPTPLPTPLPTTKPPTPLPTRPPTPLPTPIPTLPPSPYPTTQDPTPSGTLEPTRYPSALPTMSPTVSPEPTDALPSSAPSIFPSSNPTAPPSISPSGLPSSEPSSAPSLPLQNELVQSQMAMFPMAQGQRLTGRDAIVWEAITDQTIRNSILSTELDPPLFDLVVGVNIERQIPSGSKQSIKEDENSNRRFLQAGEAPDDALIIVFDVVLSYRSESKDQDVDQLVFSAFDTSLDRADYVMKLQQQSNTYAPVEDVEVKVEGYVPPPTLPPSSGGDVNIAVIVGASVGGAALIILIALLLMRRRSGKHTVVASDNGRETEVSPTTVGQNVKVSTEILVEPQDDVSTLGDPMFGQGGMMMNGMDKDEVTASIGEDYDYAKAYRQAKDPLSVGGNTMNTRDRTTSEEFTKMSSTNSAAMSKLGRMGENLFADDGSFEQQFQDPEERFDVVAPAGKLGMVIDTPNGNIPVVHAIKETSVLADQVRVGDRLLSVDGEDCVGMTAMQVSKLISLKSEKPARVLVFARSDSNTNQPQ